MITLNNIPTSETQRISFVQDGGFTRNVKFSRSEFSIVFDCYQPVDYVVAAATTATAATAATVAFVCIACTPIQNNCTTTCTGVCQIAQVCGAYNSNFTECALPCTVECSCFQLKTSVLSHARKLSLTDTNFTLIFTTINRYINTFDFFISHKKFVLRGIGTTTVLYWIETNRHWFIRG